MLINLSIIYIVVMFISLFVALVNYDCSHRSDRQEEARNVFLSLVWPVLFMRKASKLVQRVANLFSEAFPNSKIKLKKNDDVRWNKWAGRK